MKRKLKMLNGKTYLLRNRISHLYMKKKSKKCGLASFIAVGLIMSSCSKDNNGAITSKVSTIRLNIGQVISTAKPLKSEAIKRSYTSDMQELVIPLDNQYTLVATLIATNLAVQNSKASNLGITNSTGRGQNTLKKGTVYYLAIFDFAGNYKETKSFKQGDAIQDFPIDKGKYTFVIYASGTNKTLPIITQGAKLSTVIFENLGADKDFMLDQIEFDVKEGQNILDADLQHLFTQITMKFDASEIGDVSSIAGASITPSNPAVDVTLGNGHLNFKGIATSVPLHLKNTTGSVIHSDSTFITTAATSNGIIELFGVSIGGSAPRNVIKNGWIIRPGIKYQLDITLKSKPNNAVVTIAGVKWASGNLKYSGNMYSFVSRNDGIGSYWFAGYTKPKVLDINNQTPSDDVNGPEGDPCTLVQPLNSWRLPTFDEALLLMRNTSARGVENPKTIAGVPARYADSYLGGAGGNWGVYFGVQDNPSLLREQYLFLPSAGVYKGNTTLVELGINGYYLLADYNYIRFNHSQVKPSFSSDYSIGNITSNQAMQVRCVKK